MDLNQALQLVAQKKKAQKNPPPNLNENQGDLTRYGSRTRRPQRSVNGEKTHQKSQRRRQSPVTSRQPEREMIAKEGVEQILNEKIKAGLDRHDHTLRDT